MAIKAGDKIPSVTVKQLSSDGMQDLATDSVFGGKKVVMFTVVGAFTPTCSANHLPGFVQNLDKFKEQGIEVACLAVNDPFVMKAWSEASKADGITMLADGNGTFTKALGLEMDGTGLRSWHPRTALCALRRKRRGQIHSGRKDGRMRSIERRSDAQIGRRAKGVIRESFLK